MKQIYFTNETPKEIFNRIDYEFSYTEAPWVTVVTLKNGSQHHGFMHHFDDSKELAKEFKFRLVIQNQSSKFKEERDRDKVLNPKYSVAIFAGDVASIELVNPHLIKN